MRGLAQLESWKYHTPFIIARGAITASDLLVVELRDGDAVGRGEACPMPHYGETPEGELEHARQIVAALERGEDWAALHDGMGPGAARNAIDCAIWDLRAKQAGRPIASLLDLPPLRPVVTAYTLGIDTPDAMARHAAERAPRHSLLKVKLGAEKQDLDRIRAVRGAAPKSRLIVDVNEAWDGATLAAALPVLKENGVELLEQPLPAGRDEALAGIEHLIPIAADESCHTTADLDRLVGLYDVVNIKLDKTGGLTEALRLQSRAKALGMGSMIGCMTATSLAIAPGIVVAQDCRFVDLDGPLLLGNDRPEHLTYQGDLLLPPTSALWG